ncbi:unnamed protein product [Hymenolepis diminuta]|uniref:Protein phosphatase 1 regulatory subunit 21 N-terminal domain-containing protein n=1 Tax=Hymenolepis diminuta TaxID=6216 RepID=A0A3P6XZD0_HYMDI|nr:unnamed protein product [Hymenolepis diminuta]
MRSKYTRLGVEFKKLRERHRTLKDSYKESTGRITHLESKLTDQTIHMRNLEHEKESLIFRNQYLIKQAAFLEKQLEATNPRRGRPTSNGCSVDNQIHDDALKNALAEVHKLHEDLVAQSSQFLARIADLESSNSQSSKQQRVSVAVQASFPTLSPFNQSSFSVDGASSSLDALCLQDARELQVIERDVPQMKNNASSASPPSPHLPPPTAVQTETLRNLPSPGINEGIYTVKVTPNLPLPPTEMSPRMHSLPIIGSSDSADAPDSLSPKENILLERISQLESQLAEMSLKQRLEIRRSQLSQQATSGVDSSDPSSSFPVENEPSVKEKLLVEYYEAQLHDRTKQLALYVGRVADAYSEIRSLTEHLRCTRRESERRRRETSAAIARADSLKEELEMTKQRAAQQLTEMAQHLANLTDDLYVLRGGSNTASPSNVSTSSASKVCYLLVCFSDCV